jgi:uncharacterized protein (DUF433 family)
MPDCDLDRSVALCSISPAVNQLEKTDTIDRLLQGVDPDKQGRAVRKTLPRRYCRDLAKMVFAGRLCQISMNSMPATGYRYLINLPNVRGGNTIVEGTRIGVHDVVALIVNGPSVDDAVRSFPDLTRAQVYECLAYYEDHRAEIDALVARQMSSGM